MELANEQSVRIYTEKHSEKFIAAIWGLLVPRQCKVQSLRVPQYDSPTKQQGFIRYKDETFYLYADTAYKHVYVFYGQQGIRFPVTEKRC